MIKSTRRTQPLRKKLRQKGTAVELNMTRGRAAGGFNKADAARGAANGTGGVQAPTSGGAKVNRPGAPKTGGFGKAPTPLPQVTEPWVGRSIGRPNRGRRPGGLGQALREAAVRAGRGSGLRGPIGKPKGSTLPKDRPRTHETTRGKRRLSFEEAYARRTTDTSRARVEKLYGKTATAEQRSAATENRSLAPGEQKLSVEAQRYGSLSKKLRAKQVGKQRRSRRIDRSV